MSSLNDFISLIIMEVAYGFFIFFGFFIVFQNPMIHTSLFIPFHKYSQDKHVSIKCTKFVEYMKLGLFVFFFFGRKRSYISQTQCLLVLNLIIPWNYFSFFCFHCLFRFSHDDIIHNKNWIKKNGSKLFVTIYKNNIKKHRNHILYTEFK